MSRLQVFNWGTFNELHSIPISEKGFLFVGSSGSGKSTLLDALSALLIPPKSIDFNAAARETDRKGRDRNLVTYIRGAWSVQPDDESGVVATQFLRPSTTYSALALTYSNGAGKTVVLVQLFWLLGKDNKTTDVNRWYFIFERPFDLMEMKGFDLDIRKLKQNFQGVFIKDEFSAYCERFRHLLGIQSETALKLLGKTQSAKNMTDLNKSLRENMLDKPKTFDAAEQLVMEFTELKDAYTSVVTARQQVEILQPARENYQTLQAIQGKQLDLHELQIGVDGFKELCKIDLLNSRIDTAQREAQTLEAEEEIYKADFKDKETTLVSLRRQHADLGGARIEILENEIALLEKEREEKIRKTAVAEGACKKLGWPIIKNQEDYSRTLSNARDEIENLQPWRKTIQDQQFAIAASKQEHEKQFADVANEVRALERQRSNIPFRMLELRSRIAEALNLDDAALPFVGELIEVRQDEAAWRGAVERVLYNFAVSLLVEEDLYPEVSQFVNSTNLRGRLVYHRVDANLGQISKKAPANSLFHKLNIQANSYTEWLETELKMRFDYACVDSIQEFRNSERAVTITGQIRHNRTRHEKNDRYEIDDSSQWVLGFDNREKLTLFKNRAQTLAKEMNELGKKLEALTSDDNRKTDRIRICQTLVDVQWQEINLKSVIERISNNEQALEEARKGNKDLERTAQQIARQEKVVEKAHSEWVALKNEIHLVQKMLRDLNTLLEKTLQNSAHRIVTTFQKEGLSQRFDSLEQPMTLENIDEQVRSVEKALNEEIKSLDTEENRLIRAIEERFAEFKRRWALESADMDSTLASVSDFLNMLHRLEIDGLPTYEERFFNLLQTQSQENLTILSQYLVLERRAILEGMAKVNESLRQAPFNPGTHLQIKVADLQLSDVLEFRNNIQEALSHAFAENRENAEARFLIISNIVKRLSSKAPEDRNWRELVLDVRLHVEFLGQELSENGEIKNIYRSGAGKSGGQREKLTTTCLAAALRFQLCGNNDGLPIYAPVVLDEAFSKADHLFTTSAMNIFRTFGFQMIVATPYRAVRTFELFIGGACAVHINAEQSLSSVLPIVYDESSQRLNFEKSINDQALAEAS